MVGNKLNGKVANILFGNTTSHNSKDEIFQAFDMCHVRPKLNKPLCSFYQGCGCDIITISKNDIHIHIFSDRDDSCKEQISQKLKKLESEGYIAGLLDDDTGWVFEQNGRIKRMFFTTKSIDAIDFSSMYGVSLFLVFECNPGDVTCKESFWDSIKKQLIPGGYVIGSYTFTDKFTDRQAFLLYNTDNKVHLCGRLCEVDKEEKRKLIERFKKSGDSNTQGHSLQVKFFEYSQDLYELVIISERTIFVYKLWHKSICSFELKDAWWGDHICILQKS